MDFAHPAATQETGAAVAAREHVAGDEPRFVYRRRAVGAARRVPGVRVGMNLRRGRGLGQPSHESGGDAEDGRLYEGFGALVEAQHLFDLAPERGVARARRVEEASPP